MERIAIYGGTFNPIHNGHLHIATEFTDRLGVDRLLFIPTNVPPHKRPQSLQPAETRLEMCRLAVEETKFEVSDLEIRRKGASYTVDTLEQLAKIYPGSPLYLIVGEDMFLTFLKWRNPQRIFQLATLCAAPRSEHGVCPLKEYARKIEALGAQVRIENITYLPISSTMVREAVKAGNDISKMVPEKVADYIRRNHLYEE